MMSCGQNRETLAAYLDGEVTSAQASAFEQHLRNCTECATEIAILMSTRRSMKAARARFAPTSQFRQKVKAQIAPRGRRYFSLRMLPIAIAALAVVIVASSMLLVPVDPDRKP
jgi:anti-sigma factor RsiW